MPDKALDTTSNCEGEAHNILNAGYVAVGQYARTDRSSRAGIAGLLSVGLKIFWVFEKGNPTHVGYFTEAQGSADAAAFLSYAAALGIPMGSLIHAAYDYDATLEDIHGPCFDYHRAFHDRVKDAGYRVGAYGNWTLVNYFYEQGYSESRWVSGSSGWSGYGGPCEIQQGSTTGVMLSGDADEVYSDVVYMVA